MADDDATGNEVALPYRDPTVVRDDDILHLVIAFSYDEPERVGQAAAVDRACWLGRPDRTLPPVDLLEFVEQRPGSTGHTRPLRSPLISRRQMSIELRGADKAYLIRQGQRELFVNGAPVEEAQMGHGDTVRLGRSMVLVAELRPKQMLMLQHHRGQRFAFGGADQAGMVGETPVAWALRDHLAGAAASDEHVLLFGESGAGKGVAAELLHSLSLRTGPLVLRNAPTLTSGLVDAELFGNLKDYPNPGMPHRQGIIGAADGGYLFLDEIGNVTHSEQEHLLTVLDNGGKYQQLGNDQLFSSNFRLVATTNRSMTSLKHDLAARCRHRIVVPGLNERRSDIPFLILRHLRQAQKDKPGLMQRFSKNGDVSIRWMDPAFLDALVGHWYTHHTRELERYLDLSILESRKEYLELAPEVEQAMGSVTDEAPAASFSRPRQLPTVEEARQALEDACGNISAAARVLGIHRDRLRRLLGKKSR